MSRLQRIGLLVVAAVIGAGAFLILKDGGDDDSSDTPTTTQTTSTTDTQGTTTTPAPEAEPAPEVATITIEAGKPVGGVKEIELKKGEVLNFRVKSDEEHEVHLHGYDLEKEVAAGGQVSFKLKASLDGIYEVELEDLKVPIAEVRINP